MLGGLRGVGGRVGVWGVRMVNSRGRGINWGDLVEELDDEVVERIETYPSIGHVADRARTEACVLERASHAGRAVVALHSCVKVGVEVELDCVTYIGSRGIRREDESAFADVDLDYFRGCAACHQGKGTESNG